MLKKGCLGEGGIQSQGEGCFGGRDHGVRKHEAHSYMRWSCNCCYLDVVGDDGACGRGPRDETGKVGREENGKVLFSPHQGFWRKKTN